MGFIEVSHEMTVLLGAGGAARAPKRAIAALFRLGGAQAPSSVTLEFAPRLAALKALAAEGVIVLMVDREAVRRIGGAALLDAPAAAFYLPAELRAIAAALRDPPAAPEARSTYQLAKSIELLCETVRRFAGGEMAPLAAEAALSLPDQRRILKARALIDERWNEKLTLDQIARACGLNRAKLTRGFREMFDCSVAEAIAERRLAQASHLLLTTDLPVSSVGYEAGYLNNASFARAFGRRFGRTPTDYRAVRLIAA
jgi:AraC family transcriptional activator of pyochelin receptor